MGQMSDTDTCRWWNLCCADLCWPLWLHKYETNKSVWSLYWTRGTDVTNRSELHVNWFVFKRWNHAQCVTSEQKSHIRLVVFYQYWMYTGTDYLTLCKQGCRHFKSIVLQLPWLLGPLCFVGVTHSSASLVSWDVVNRSWGVTLSCDG